VKTIAAVLKEREAFFPPAEQLASATRAAMLQFDQSAATFEVQRQQVLDTVARGALASLEYTNDRPLNQPSTSNLRLVGEVGGFVDFTANGSITFFDTRTAGTSGSLRDYEISGQVDVPLGSPARTGGFVLSFAGKFMDQRENTIGAAGMPVPDTKGTWTIFQAKLLIPMKGTGAKIPISFTAANRTELIKEKRIFRANFGVTYDLDMLFARFKPL
jgi:hypothetical protein